MSIIREWVAKTGWVVPSDIEWITRQPPTRLVPCPTCKVGAYIPCQTIDGKPHSARIRLVEIIIRVILTLG